MLYCTFSIILNTYLSFLLSKYVTVVSFHLQFQCCGVDSSMDWFDLNPDAVMNNGGNPPAKCSCDLSNDKCKMFAGPPPYNAWQDVSQLHASKSQK